MIAIAAVQTHSLGLKADGTVAAWGDDFAGETDVPSGLSNVVAIAAGSEYSLALKTDGTVVAWGWHSQPPALPSSVRGVMAIVASPDGNRNLAIVGPPAVPPKLGNAQYLTDGSFRLGVSGEEGRSYVVQASSNLVDRVGVRAFPAINGETSITDPLARNFPHRFYRAVTP